MSVLGRITSSATSFVINLFRSFELGATGKNSPFFGYAGNINDVWPRQIERMTNAQVQARRNKPYLARAASNSVRYIIGTGILPAVRNNKSELQRIVTEYVLKPQFDIEGRLDLFGISRLAVQTCFIFGEVLIIKKPVRAKPGGLPFRVQLLNPAHLAKITKMVNGNRIVNGVEFSPDGEILGYHILPNLQKPETIRLERRDVIHWFITDEPGQTRGTPWGASSTPTLGMLSDWARATLSVQRVAACLQVFIRNRGAKDVVMPEKLEPGDINVYSGDAEPFIVNPPQSQPFDGAAAAFLREAAAGFDQPYELLSMDLSKVTFLSGRLGLADWLLSVSVKQQDFITQVLMRLEGWIYDGMTLAGLKRDTSDVIKWTPPPQFAWDKMYEVNARVQSIRAGFETMEEVASSKGLSLDELLADIQRYNELADSLGIVLAGDSRRTSLSGGIQGPHEGDDKREGGRS